MAQAKIAVVTGGGTGVGKSSALALMKAGWDVALCGRRKEPLEAVAKEGAASGRKVITVPADVADPDLVKTLFARIHQFARRRATLRARDRPDLRDALPGVRE